MWVQCSYLAAVFCCSLDITCCHLMSPYWCTFPSCFQVWAEHTHLLLHHAVHRLSVRLWFVISWFHLIFVSLIVRAELFSYIYFFSDWQPPFFLRQPAHYSFWPRAVVFQLRAFCRYRWSRILDFVSRLTILYSLLPYPCDSVNDLGQDSNWFVWPRQYCRGSLAKWLSDLLLIL